MLRITCPTPWAASLVREAVLRPRAVPVPLVGRWQHHPGGAGEILLAQVDASALAAGDSLRAELRVGTPSLPAGPETEPGTLTLWVGRAGRWRALARPETRHGFTFPVYEADELWLPGPGMHLLSADTPSRPPAIEGRRGRQQGGSVAGWHLACGTGRDSEGPFSRQAGALGWPAVEALRQRSFALVGCGRSGHALAMLLASWQPRELVLIDHDAVEAGNRDAGIAFAAPRSDDGGPSASKVEALGGLLSALLPSTRVVPLPLGILTERAARMAAACDVIVSATDEDTARFRCAAIASAFHRVHLDVGSLVGRDAQARMEVGADIRLMLPGGRDLCCLGGFASPENLRRHADGQPTPAHARWHDHKAGALTSWSTVVAGLAVRLLEDLAAERLRESLWLRATQGAAETTPRLQQLTAPPDPYCPLCAIAGTGDAWLQRTADLAGAAVLRARRSDMRSRGE